MKRIITALALGLVCAATPAGAVEIVPGDGITYAAKFVFQKKDTKAGASALSVYSGQTIDTPGDGGSPASIPTTKSMAWCDPATNPPAGAVPGTCYGWAMHSKWFLIDLSGLKAQGLSKLNVTINAKRYIGSDPAKSDLIPALTVWRGNQNQGPHLHWYPSQFQTTPPFWGWLLTPWTSKTNPGYMSAYGVGPQTVASVSGPLTLKGRKEDWLTVAVGGDAKHGDASQKHDVYFQLEVDVKQASSGGGGGQVIDPNGCVVGKTCWHPPMSHCMNVDLCNLPQYLGQCQCY
ncbi:hypothetical protein [Methylococcus capsulatus]|uniref:hypothetical protein n=1 Tax=Methylococcus capsulatus TaxID=414 RepID=UPI001C52D0C0|nr:hypothetical protein [Methylococcus capsulatus]QXP88738.1 hypothetical protein KW112_06440 [Methylococcus capsulatus]QXP94230.1 hypothetical protein KW113_03195 [Methylococcus capsulatus]UQN11017.1 hypothetical protein M3M30_08185 [Methylococcus capsulatus]